MAYERQYYTNGDVLNAEQLNHMEAGIKENSDNVSKLSEDISDLKENGTGSGTAVSSVEPMEDDIPKVFFSEAIPQTKDDAITAFRYISKTEDISGYAEFKAQGNSSMSYPKKNMTVKMYSDEALTEKLKVDFKEWGEQAKHVYKANWIDLTHARNIVSARLWADVVKSRANYSELPELLRTSPNQGAVDGFQVKVYSQGVYQGRYTLNIPKDAWMANMDDELDNHCILCGENYVSGCFRATANINGSDWSDEVHDTVPTSIKTRWNEIISFVMNSTDEEFVANLENYFFVDSLIDYFIFGMVSCGLDAFGKNQLYFTYDGMKWIASMYDMDSTWGLYWNGSKFVSASYSRESFEDFVSGRTGNLLYIRLASLFYNRIQLRYIELKNSALSIPNIINNFERFTDITPLDLVKEDYASTTGSGKFTTIPSQSTNNIQQIRKFVVDRYAYCDEYFASIGDNDEEPDAPNEPSNPEQSGILYENYSPSGNSFSKTVSIDWETQYIEASIDLSGCVNKNENILSVGENIGVWNGSNSYHIYYEPENKQLSIYAITGTVRPFGSCNFIKIDTTDVVVRADKMGIYINGQYLSKDTFVDDVDKADGTGAMYAAFVEYIKTLSTLQIGSMEGKVRSCATYNYIKILESVPCTNISLDKSSLLFNGDGIQSLIATVIPSDTTEIVIWNSDNIEVANVDNGLVSSFGKGSAVITATCGEHSASCTVTAIYESEVPLRNGTKDFANGSNLTISNNNHISLESGADLRDIFLNISNLTKNNTNETDKSNYNNDLVKRFDLKTGDVIVQKISNLVCSDNNTALKMALNMIKTDGGEIKICSDIVLANMTDDLERTYTATADNEIAIFNMWIGSSIPIGFKVEFDLSITINGVRYV